MVDADKVNMILANVREGIRTEDDLFKCGCPECRSALQLMWELAVLKKLQEVKK